MAASVSFPIFTHQMAKKRIICTVITDLNYDQRMQRICTALAEDGYEVLLVGRRLNYSIPLKERPYQQKRFKLWFNKEFLFYAEYNIRLFFFLLFSKVDLICSIDLDSILPGFLVSKLRGKTFVHDAHELFTEMPELKNPMAKKVWSGLEGFIFPRTKYAYTESDGYKAVYESNYPTPFEVIRNVPFYWKLEDYEKPSSSRYLLYQGALNVGRGLEQLLAAMQQVEMPLWLCGEGELSQELRALAKSLNIEHKVRFLGMVTPEELRGITANAFIGLNLLEPSNRHYQLSFPNKLFDYIMGGLPQISMNFESYRSILKEEEIGVLIDEMTPAAIGAAIRKLIEDEAFYLNCKASCMRLREVHNWNKEKQKLLEFYKRIL